MNSFFLSEANKLRNIQIFLEKNDNNCLSKYGDECDLSNYYIQTEKTRKTELDHNVNELRKIWTLLETKKKALVDDISNLDLKSFKKDLIVIQDKIYDMRIKLNMSIQELQDQEIECSQALEIYNQKVEEWEKPIKNLTYNNNKRISVAASGCNYEKEIKEFVDFINKNKGHQNGWSNNDHQLFLKFRRKYKDPEVIAVNLNKILPDLTPQCIQDHEMWYRKYLKLKDKKNEALEKWRRMKNEYTSHQNNDESSNCPKTAPSTITVDKSTQEKIAIWKAEKEAKRRQQQMNEQFLKERLKQKDDERRKIHEEVKESVAKWKQAKLAKEKNEKIHNEIMELEEKKLKAAEANKMIKRFQSQDDIFIMKMRYQRLSEKTEIRRTKSSCVANRDPQRLLKPTKQWLIRISKDNFLDGNKGPPPNVRTIPKLGIPDWRKNVIL